jgi:putative oxidoreductase
MKFRIVIPTHYYGMLLSCFNVCTDIGDLLVRLWLAKIFLDSAVTKITDWGSTVVLFKYVYSVPVMSPTAAAYLGTFAEFFLPIMLLIGLGGRFLVFLFFIYNLFCAISFHYLWTPAGAAGLASHTDWALLLLMLMLHGCGRISLDYVIHQRWGYLLKVGKTFHIDFSKKKTTADKT